jgi:hypothetical protein
VWHSLFRQYVPPQEWELLQQAFRRAVEAGGKQRPVIWLSMEPSHDPGANVQLALRTHPDETERHLAWCGDHGPPVRWEQP